MMVPSEVLEKKTSAESVPVPVTTAEDGFDGAARQLIPPAVSVLPANLLCMAKLAARESPRYAMNGLRLTVDRENIKVEATDGRVLGIVTGPNDDDHPEDLVRLAKVDGEPAKTAVIPREVWEEAFESIPDKKFWNVEGQDLSRHIGVLSISMTSTLKLPDSNQDQDGPVALTFGHRDGDREVRLSARGISGRYPDTAYIMNPLAGEKKPLVIINFDAALLRRILSVAEEFTGADSRRVKLTIYDPTMPMFVQSRNAAGQKFVGAIMPINEV